MHSYPELLALIEEEIASQPFKGTPQNLYDPLNYILQLGGKRIRPVLALMGCELFSDNFERAMPLAMSIELFHNFSLIHDDIMDKAPLRRGKPTVHKKWDRNIAIQSGDLMLVKAYEALAQSKVKNLNLLFEIFNQTATGVCEGQQMDMNFEKQDDVTELEYIEMIRLKTSVLLGCSLQLGAMVAGAKVEDAKSLYHFGIHLGLGFQLMDDYLDAFGTPEEVGKQPGGDILSGKKTLLVIQACKFNKDELLSILHDNQLDSMLKISKVKAIFKNSGAEVYVKNRSMLEFEKAESELMKIEAPEQRKTELFKLLDFIKMRRF